MAVSPLFIVVVLAVWLVVLYGIIRLFWHLTRRGRPRWCPGCGAPPDHHYGFCPILRQRAEEAQQDESRRRAAE